MNWIDKLLEENHRSIEIQYDVSFSISEVINDKRLVEYISIDGEVERDIRKLYSSGYGSRWGGELMSISIKSGDEI